MAVPPKFAAQKFIVGSNPVKALHTIECYLDFVCPFSAKMFKTLNSSILSSSSSNSSKPYTNHVQFVVRQSIQPWHPSSTLVHEAGLAVLRIAPEKYWTFIEKLFERQVEYFDVNVVNETRNKTYKRLSELASSVGVDQGKVYGLLEVPDKPSDDGSANVGNGVTDDVKLITKMNRLTGIHVTPTVLFNGVVEGGISSSFSGDQWDEWLTKNCSPK